MRPGTFSILLPPAYLPPVAYYVAKACAREATVCYDMPFNKRLKSVHRTTISDANGIISLTIPIQKPATTAGTLWSDILISDHNRWWDIHLTALKSAYGRTPFFEYYLNDILPFYSPDVAGQPLTRYLSRYDALLTRLLGVDIVRRQLAPKSPDTGRTLPLLDYRRTPIEPEQTVPYYQQRTAGATFTDHLSAADLLFNMGPESMLILAHSRL
ncbi:MAG: WbqC family protein [Muribaculaceae bacterium]|nr:WbqC family protein [Muribaculaceae bacterium]